jgi:hypothetical protein
LSGTAVAASFSGMHVTEIMEAIKELPPEQRGEIARFAQQFGGRQLTPEELGELAERLAAATDPAEAAAIEKAIVNGFYGAKIDA